MEFTPAARRTIERLAAAARNYGKVWDEAAVIAAMREYYAELKVPMPKTVVIDDLVIGYKESVDLARDTAWDTARDTAWDTTRAAAWGAARGAAWDTAWGAAWDTAWGAARDAARGAARGAAWDTAWGAAWAAAIQNAGLDKDPKVAKFIALEAKLLQALEAGLGWFFPMQDQLLLVPMPQLKVSDERLHSEDGPAVLWRGGLSYHFLHGVRLDEKLWQKITTKKLTGKEALSLENIEQRMVALKLMDPEKMLKSIGAKLVNSSLRGNYLYQVPAGVFSITAWFLKYQDPSTGRLYVSGIDPEYAAEHPLADECMAWKFGLEPEQYEQLRVEA